MNIVVSHPTGNANLRAVLRSLGASGMLHAFHTTLAMPGGMWEPLLGEKLTRRFAQRYFPEAPPNRTHQHPVREIVRLLALRLGVEPLVRHEMGWASVDNVYRALDEATARSLARATGDVQAVYAYEDGALATFRAATQFGMSRFYDLPIAHWATQRKLLSEEAERLPEWAITMDGLLDSAEKLARKDEEIALADHIFVASSFTRLSLEARFGSNLKVTTLPYGCPAPLVAHPCERSRGAPLEIFYAGHLGQRKGIADLIEALNMLTIDWRLTLAGPRPRRSPAALDLFLSNARCTWLGVVPHRTLLEAMMRAHVFVFPSIVEGFGMVISEALAAGLPVITTAHTAAPDILTEGKDGYIVPIRDPHAVADRITRLAEDETLRSNMALQALKTATQLTWQQYEKGIVCALSKHHQ